MAFVSHAENGEDVVLMRALGHVERGHYIDIGARDPDDLSLTRAFYDRGWSGINVEPTRTGHSRFLAKRPLDLNLNMAVSSRAGVVRLSEVTRKGEVTGSSVSAERRDDEARDEAFRFGTIDVPALTLADVCEHKSFEQIHFLKIPVEDAAETILKGADFLRFRPWIVVIKLTGPHTPRADDGCRGILDSSGYDCCLFDGVNFFFNDRERPELAAALSTPANVRDGYVSIAFDVARRRLAESEQALTEATRIQEGLLEELRVLTSERDAARIDAADYARQAEVQADASAAGAAAHEAALAAAIAARETAIGWTESLEGRLDASARQLVVQTGALALALETITGLQERLATDGEQRVADVARLTEDLNHARAQLSTLEAFRRDSERLHRIAGVLGGSLSVATQNNGLESLQRSFAARLGAWRAEIERDQADLKAQLDAALGRHDLVMASTSWRLTAPLRRLRRATHMIRREPHRLPRLVARRLLGRGAEAASPAPPSAVPVPELVSSLEAIAITASRVENELGSISELLQTLSATLAERSEDPIGASFIPAAQPGSGAYRALTFEQKLASWIRFDANRRRRAA